MGLNIKNERVHALAREAARRTGQSQTSVIEAALERLLAELEEPDVETRVQRMRAIAQDAASRLTDVDRAEMRRLMEEMYDPATGLPQ